MHASMPTRERHLIRQPGRPPGRPRAAASTGFTLIELMIVVVVVAILAAIAVPGYQEQVRKTRRSTATAELLTVAQALERYSTVNGTYIATAGNPTATPPTSDSNGLCNRSLPYYTISCNTLTATTFELRAVPAGAQTGDRCGTYSYTQAGQKGLVGATSGLTVADCW
jgi:type IV pilus assembly protein PilE